ncbi:MAG: right-handed parallel beta-helix repeat-containing protein [Thermoplasmatales archaeon]|nr:right-handed parallel beta-helix repeat-containing protein [Thermoplasmatales archaeon]
MVKNVFRKGLVIGIIILFVGAVVVPSIESISINKQFSSETKTCFNNLSSKSKTLYVGGSGPDNYTKIKDAIADANSGDTIFVYNGLYNENLVIDKSLTLIGENRNDTIVSNVIEDNGCTVWVTEDNVNIIEFGITNSSCSRQGLRVRESDNFSITSCNIFGNYGGVLISHSNNINIEDCSIFQNIGGAGINFWDVHHSNILNCKLYENPDGIYFDTSTNNKIISCNSFNNTVGLYLDFSSNNNLIENCDTSDNQWWGIRISRSSNNTIKNINVFNNLDCGILVTPSSDNNKIFGNTISSNNGYGIWLGDSSNYNIIYHNNFINNGENAYDECNNTWDDGKYGNYWSDYKEKYPNAKKKLLKPWMWDTPYEIPGGENKDSCPLIKQWPDSKPRTISRNTASYSSYLLRFLERFPNAFPLLRLLLQRLGLQ